MQGLGRIVGQGRVQGEAVGSTEPRERPGVAAGTGLPGQHRALVQGEAPVGRDEAGLEIFHAAKARAVRAGAP